MLSPVCPFDVRIFGHLHLTQPYGLDRHSYFPPIFGLLRRNFGLSRVATWRTDDKCINKRVLTVLERGGGYIRKPRDYCKLSKFYLLTFANDSPEVTSYTTMTPCVPR